MTIKIRKTYNEKNGTSSFECWNISKDGKRVGHFELYTIDLRGWHSKNCLLRFVDGYSEDALRICNLLCDEHRLEFEILDDTKENRVTVKKFVVVNSIRLDREHRRKGFGREALNAISERKFKRGVNAVFLVPGPYDCDDLTQVEIDSAIQKIANSYELVGFQSFYGTSSLRHAFPSFQLLR